MINLFLDMLQQYSLIGLENIKQVLKDLVDLIELKNKTKDDLKIKDINLHMVFLGNPGTEKQTDKIKVLSIAPLFAEAIKRVNEAQPLGDLFDFDK